MLREILTVLSAYRDHEESRSVSNSPSKVIEEVVKEDHRDDTLAPGRLLGILQLSSSEGDPCCKRAAHAAGSNLALVSV